MLSIKEVHEVIRLLRKAHINQVIAIMVYTDRIINKEKETQIRRKGRK